MSTWGIVIVTISILLILVMLGLIFLLSTKNRARELNEENKGIPIGPPPAQSNPIQPTGPCLPQKSTDKFKECTSSLECKTCSEKPNGNYLECTKVPYNQTVNINGAKITDDGKNYCLPATYNVCTPGYGESVWKAEGGLENWECNCVYDQKYNLFRQTVADGDCNVNVACNKLDFRVCDNDVMQACTHDDDCTGNGKCTGKPNRLVSRPRSAIANECLMKSDPDCQQTYVSNFALDTTTGKPAEGTGMPDHPLLVTKQVDSEGNVLGINIPDWDPSVDGPLLYNRTKPPWMTRVPEKNPNCQGAGNETNPGCSVADENWGGECSCDANQNLVSWKDYQEATAVNALPEDQTQLAKAKQVQEETSQYFSCRPDTCHVPHYVKIADGDPGPRLVTPENTKYIFGSASGELPPNLVDYQCWCGNVKKDGNAYTSWIPYKVENQPNSPPVCRPDPCNPNGFFNPSIGICECKNGAVEQTSENWTGSKCVNLCESHICGPHGTCELKDKTSYTCICNPCWEGERCEVRKKKKGDSCGKSSECCSPLSCKAGFGGTFCE
jgi:hypothetical protein